MVGLTVEEAAPEGLLVRHGAEVHQPLPDVGGAEQLPGTLAGGGVATAPAGGGHVKGQAWGCAI